MKAKIYTLKDAQDWFLKNHFGRAICVVMGVEMEVNSYKEARKFFENMEEQVALNQDAEG